MILPEDDTYTLSTVWTSREKKKQHQDWESWHGFTWFCVEKRQKSLVFQVCQDPLEDLLLAFDNNLQGREREESLEYEKSLFRTTRGKKCNDEKRRRKSLDVRVFKGSQEENISARWSFWLREEIDEKGRWWWRRQEKEKLKAKISWMTNCLMVEDDGRDRDGEEESCKEKSCN